MTTLMTQAELLELDINSSRQLLLDKKVRVHLTKDEQLDHNKGIIREVSESHNEPTLPHDIKLELDGGDTIEIPIVGIDKIEFLK